MILFIFEGAKYEPPLYDGIKALFFPRATDQIICSFCSSIYTFYKRLKDEFGDSGMLGNLDMPFLAYSWKEEKKSGSFGWRLTMPVFFILVLLMYILVLPIKWILTGYFGFKQEEKLGQFFVKWYQKIYNERW